MVGHTIFPTDPTIGFPFFNTYRLASETALKSATCPLPTSHQATSSRYKAASTSSNARSGNTSQVLGLKDVKARVGWDHLASGVRENEVVYVDEGYQVVVAQINSVNGKPEWQFKLIGDLVAPLQGADDESVPEYPSVLALPNADTKSLGNDLYLASSGIGTLSIITVPHLGDATRPPTIDLDLLIPNDFSTQASPFLLHAIHIESLSHVEVALTRTVRTTDTASPSPIPGSAKSARVSPKIITSFEVLCINLDLSAESEVWKAESGGNLDIAWRLAGEDFPTLVKWSGGRWIVGGPCLYDEVGGNGAELNSAEAPSDENGVAPRNGKAEQTTETKRADNEPVYPFTWSQSHSSLTITFAFPGSLDPTRDILCVIKTNTLLLRLPESQRGYLTESQSTFFRLAGDSGLRDWWDAVRGDESTWTWEKPTAPGGHGTLTLHLEKVNAGVKWPQPFAPLQNDGDELAENDDETEEKEQDTEVPETVSEEEQAATRARLEQFHSAAADAGMGGIGSRNALPGLMREEMEDEDYDDDEGEIDGGEVASIGGGGSSKTGKMMRFTEVQASGAGGISVRTSDMEPVTWVLSTGIGGSTIDTPSIIIKSHVDGQVYEAPKDKNEKSWAHVGCNPALSFVLSSKRDAQYVYHILTEKGATVIAFESRQANGMGGNAYVYWPVEDGPKKGRSVSGKSKAEEGQQAVVKMDEDAKGDTGVLLGVKLLYVGGEKMVVGLTEKALVMLTGI